ncbi:outer membrane beta-barrel protein [Sphingopyxis sp. R3-92]|uniref:outer membrane beta-barrel protein n=1 Tax=Sphingopyxis sp. R3-92 TaxID=3158553 RepID=UPI003EE54C2A
MKRLILAAACAAGFAAPALAKEGESNAKAGLRVEARAVYETPTVSDIDDEDDDVYKLGSAVAFGGEVGFDVAVSSSLVVGPYLTLEKSSVKTSDGTDYLKVKDNLAAGLHIGYAVGSKGQIYGKLGYAKLRLEAQVGAFRETASGSGVQGAIGYEHGFGDKFYVRAEAGYGDNGRIGGIKFQRRHVGLGMGVRF